MEGGTGPNIQVESEDPLEQQVEFFELHPPSVKPPWAWTLLLV